MRYEYWTADVFTDRVFGGNPLAVIPDAGGLKPDQMQLVAREFNLSETSFVLPPESGDHTFRVRIFTPARELPFAGHPTVGTACVLAAAGRVKMNGGEGNVVLGEDVGAVPVSIRGGGEKPYFAQLTAAKLPQWGPSPPPSEMLAAMLSLDPTEVLDDDRDEPQAISCGVPFMFVPLASLEAVRRARLNWEWWNQYLASHWAPQVFLFAFQAETRGVAAHARMFSPWAGVDEDPATGSAAAAFAGYLVRRERPADGTARWMVEQGFEMGRPSFIQVEADVIDGNPKAVRVGGQTVLVARGHIEV
jgi:trans-2,3-dihydro-3-hydroxyanthranilate isomerase